MHAHHDVREGFPLQRHRLRIVLNQGEDALELVALDRTIIVISLAGLAPDRG